MYRVGWNIHRLTKKELCDSNECWHAWDSTFPDTNCIVFFQINPHWICHLGLVVLETFRERPGKRRRESCFTRTMLLHTSLWLRDCGSELVDHSPYSPDWAPSCYFMFPNMKKTTLGWEAVSDRWWCHICSWWLFQGSGWEFLYLGNPSAATPMEEVCGSQGGLHVEK